MNKLRKKRVVDGLMDAYVSWREACLRVRDAYGSWTGERGLRAAIAFETYMAELDREEDAAEAYAVLVRKTSALVSAEHGPFLAFGSPPEWAEHH